MQTKTQNELANLNTNKYSFSMPENNVFEAQKGLNEDFIKMLSQMKEEPDWMLKKRQNAYEIFKKKKMPTWGADLSGIDFDSIRYYIKPSEKEESAWEDLPNEIKDTYEKLGIPEAEKKYLSGVKAQYESEVIYGSLLGELKQKGVIFLGMDMGLKMYPDLVREYFGTVIPAADNKFSALNTAVWSGGSFIYIPKGVKLELPLQAYFRVNAKNMGQFERTLIIADEGSFVSYIEGCTAPIYSTNSLHSAVVEIIVKKNARVRYTTIQNWSTNMYNLVTKRAFVYENGLMEWVDANLGSKVTMKYPSVYLMESHARGTVLSMAFASKNQYLDAGAKAVHLSSNTTSQIVSKSISKDGGRADYRGLVKVVKNAKNCKNSVVCDALILDDISRSDTYPIIDIANKNVQVGHEASVGKINDEQLYYLTSRGIPGAEAVGLIVNGFIEPIIKELPMEYAAELNRLVLLEMEGSVG